MICFQSVSCLTIWCVVPSILFASNQFPASWWSIIVLSIVFAFDHFLAPELICSTISLLCFFSVPCFWTDLLYCQSYTYIFAATTNIKTSEPYNSVKKLCFFSIVFTELKMYKYINVKSYSDGKSTNHQGGWTWRGALFNIVPWFANFQPVAIYKYKLQQTEHFFQCARVKFRWNCTWDQKGCKLLQTIRRLVFRKATSPLGRWRVFYWHKHDSKFMWNYFLRQDWMPIQGWTSNWCYNFARQDLLMQKWFSQG